MPNDKDLFHNVEQTAEKEASVKKKKKKQNKTGDGEKGMRVCVCENIRLCVCMGI